MRPSLLVTVEVIFIDNNSNTTLLGSAKLVLEDNLETVSQLACRATEAFASVIIEYIGIHNIDFDDKKQHSKSMATSKKLIFKYYDGNIICFNIGAEISEAVEFSAFLKLGLVSGFAARGEQTVLNAFLGFDEKEQNLHFKIVLPFF